MENKNNPTSADKLKGQATCDNRLNNNPGNTSTGGGQSGQYDKLNYGSEGCSTCKEDFGKNIDSLVGQVENHGSKEHKQQEHEVNAAFGKQDNHAAKTGANKSFDNYEKSPKSSGSYSDTDKNDGKEGSYTNGGKKEGGYANDGKSGSYDQTSKNGFNGQTGKNIPFDSANKDGVRNQTDKNTSYGSGDKNGQYGTTKTGDRSGEWNKDKKDPAYGNGMQTDAKNTADYQKKNGKEIK